MEFWLQDPTPSAIQVLTLKIVGQQEFSSLNKDIGAIMQFSITPSLPSASVTYKKHLCSYLAVDRDPIVSC